MECNLLLLITSNFAFQTGRHSLYSESKQKTDLVFSVSPCIRYITVVEYSVQKSFFLWQATCIEAINFILMTKKNCVLTA